VEWTFFVCKEEIIEGKTVKRGLYAKEYVVK